MRKCRGRVPATLSRKWMFFFVEWIFFCGMDVLSKMDIFLWGMKKFSKKNLKKSKSLESKDFECG